MIPKRLFLSVRPVHKSNMLAENPHFGLGHMCAGCKWGMKLHRGCPALNSKIRSNAAKAVDGSVGNFPGRVRDGGMAVEPFGSNDHSSDKTERQAAG